MDNKQQVKMKWFTKSNGWACS